MKYSEQDNASLEYEGFISNPVCDHDHPIKKTAFSRRCTTELLQQITLKFRMPTSFLRENKQEP